MRKKIGLAVALIAAVSLAESPRLATTANNNFGFNLFKTVKDRTTKGNKFLSPISAYLALAMVQNGAQDETAEEILEALTLAGIDRSKFNEANLALLTSLTSSKRHTLKIANSVWSRKGFDVRKDFKDLVTYHYRAEAAALDFDTKGAVDTINGWVSKNTEGKIDGIVKEIQPEEVLLLVNATYFQAKWEKQFTPNSTHESPFVRADKQEVVVPFLNKTEYMPYVEADGIKAVDLAYLGKEASLVVVLPKEGESVDEYAATLTAAKWNALTASLDKSEEKMVSLSLPKIQLAYDSALNDSLKLLGMPRAFDQGDAQLKGFSDDPRNLYISQVKQKTFLNIEEIGTTAAAVTSVFVGAAGASPELKFFQANRPYFFAIRDRKTNAVLFLGTIAEPEGGVMPAKAPRPPRP